MLRDQNTQSPIKSLFVITLASTVLLAVVVVMYLSFRQASYANIQPYHVEAKLNVQNAQLLIAEYDYGYGFNAGHQQVFKLIPNQPQTINFTISAWKNLNSLRINSDSELTLDSLMISKNGVGYQTQESAIIVSAELPLELNGITHKLLGIKD